MQYTTLGRTKLRVSVAGLGTGGFSRMGLKTGKTEDEAARLVLDAVDLGVNFIDTAPAYGTEGVVGRALTSLTRDQVVIATKSSVRRDGHRFTPEQVVASIDNSLRVMGTEYIDVFNLHGVEAKDYDYALDTLAPVLDAEKRKGKIRHIGVTENPIVDFSNEMLKRALRDPVWEVFMVGFHMMHQGARGNVFAHTQAAGRRHAAHVRGAQHLRRSAAHRARDEGTRRQGPGRRVARRHRRSARLSRSRRRRRQSDRRRLPLCAA